MIRIINLENYKLNDGEILIKVDRSSYLGNLFFMKSEYERNEVCDNYKIYFYEQLALNNKKFMRTLLDIANISKEHDVALGCWCYPKRCHAETIKNYIENKIWGVNKS